MDIDELAARVAGVAVRSSHPVVVGVSGYGGSGKSTLARGLAARVDGAVRMRGDDFLDPVRSHIPSQDWDGVDRERLVREVLDPFRRGAAGEFRRFDWSTRELSEPEPLPRADVMVLDLVGLFHPVTLAHLDLTVWCDVDLATATRRGIARDAVDGHDHERLWIEVWEPNERAFEARFTPREHADVLFPTDAPRPHEVIA